jgi:hypothetical protein
MIKFGGKIFLQAGETMDYCYDWLEDASQKGWNIDVLFSPGMGMGDRDVRRYIVDHRVNCIEIPVHEYELGHSYGGIRMAPYFRNTEERKGRLIKLFWGENTLIQ